MEADNQPLNTTLVIKTMDEGTIYTYLLRPERPA